jgi:hypothetical protein
VVRDGVESLQLVLIPYWADEGDALSVFEVVEKGLLDFPGVLVDSSGLLVIEAVLQVLCGTDFPVL